MSIIHMKHPVHGTKIATLEAEAQADEKRGWTRYDPLAPKVPSPDPIAVMAVAVEEPRKRGRPRKSA